MDESINNSSNLFSKLPAFCNCEFMENNSELNKSSTSNIKTVEDILPSFIVGAN